MEKGSFSSNSPQALGVTTIVTWRSYAFSMSHMKAIVTESPCFLHLQAFSVQVNVQTTFQAFWVCSAYLGLACLGLFSLTEYYLFYQSNTIYVDALPKAFRAFFQSVTRAPATNLTTMQAQKSYKSPNFSSSRSAYTIYMPREND